MFSGSGRRLIKMAEDQQFYKLEEDTIRYREHGTSFHTRALAPGLRLANTPLYQNPLVNFVLGGKRLSLAFGAIGVVFAQLMFKSGVVLEPICDALTCFSLVPFPIVSYLSQPFVSRVWRVYDEKTGPTDQLILEKVKWSGFGTFNEKVDVDTLETPAGKGDYRGRFGFVNLLSVKGESVKYFYINEGFSNIKMDYLMQKAVEKTEAKLEAQQKALDPKDN